MIQIFKELKNSKEEFNVNQLKKCNTKYIIFLGEKRKKYDSGKKRFFFTKVNFLDQFQKH